MVELVKDEMTPSVEAGLWPDLALRTGSVADRSVGPTSLAGSPAFPPHPNDGGGDDEGCHDTSQVALAHGTPGQKALPPASGKRL